MRWSGISLRLRNFRSPRLWALRAKARRKSADHRKRSIRINEWSAHLRTETDAAKLIDAVFEIFEETLPPALTTTTLRTRIAAAEFRAATDPSLLIPEERIAQVWNEYVHQIGAPIEAIVTADEIHNLRDAQYSASVFFLENRSINIWNIPNLVAVGNDGKVAHGCRAIEALRLLYSMGLCFENTRGARDRVRRGQLVSDQLAHRSETRSGTQYKSVLKAAHAINPIRQAHQTYLQEHGSEALGRLTVGYLNTLFPAEI